MKNYLNRCNQESSDKVIYIAGIFIFICILFIAIISILLKEFTNIPLGDCLFLKYTGFFCPGCGGTRSVVYLITGDIIKSISYNFFGTYVALLYIIFMGSHTISYITKGIIKGLKFRPLFLYIAIFLLILQWILKNFIIIFLI